jgi:hypothetical protein
MWWQALKKGLRRSFAVEGASEIGRRLFTALPQRRFCATLGQALKDLPTPFSATVGAPERRRRVIYGPPTRGSESAKVVACPEGSLRAHPRGSRDGRPTNRTRRTSRCGARVPRAGLAVARSDFQKGVGGSLTTLPHSRSQRPAGRPLRR